MKTCLYLSLTLFFSSCHNNKIEKLYEAREQYLLSNYKEANEIYEELYEEKWGDFVNLELAQTAYNTGEFSKAIRLYKSALQISNNVDYVGTIHYNLGICYTANNQKEEAINSYKKSIKCFPTKAAKHNLLLLKQKEIEENKNKYEHTKSTHEEIALKIKSNRQSASNLKEIKIEKELDELSRLDAESKKKAYSKINNANNKSGKKDW